MNREKVIEGLRRHKTLLCLEHDVLCPYYKDNACCDGGRLAADALALLESLPDRPAPDNRDVRVVAATMGELRLVNAVKELAASVENLYALRLAAVDAARGA